MRRKLREARVRKGWRLELAAEQVGCAPNTFSLWELGKQDISEYYKYRLCEIFGLETDDLENEESISGVFSSVKKLSSLSYSNLTTRLVYITLSSDYTHTSIPQAIAQAIEEFAAMSSEHDAALTRREALQHLAMFPILLGSQGMQLSPEETVKHCASGITACRYLRKGGYEDMKFASLVLSDYLPPLKAIAKDSSQYRKEAARQASQCLRLKSTLAYTLDSPKQVPYAEQAVSYAEQGDDPLFTILAYRELSAAYYDNHRYKPALQAAEKAAYRMEQLQKQKKKLPVPDIVQSWVYAGLAKQQAVHSHLDTLTSLSKAWDTLDTSPDQWDILTFHHEQSNMLRMAGNTYYHLRQYDDSLAAFGEIIDLDNKDIIAKLPMTMSGYLAVVSQALLSSLKATQPSKERSIALFKAGAEKAKSLQSKQREGELLSAYDMMEVIWRDDTDVLELRELMVA